MEREIKKQRSEANNKFCHVKKKSSHVSISLTIVIIIYIHINWFNLFIQNSSISSCILWHSKSYKIDSLCKKSCSENSRNFSHRRISYKNEEDHLDTSLWQSDQLHWQDLPWCFYFFGPKNFGSEKETCKVLAMQVEGTFDFYAHQRGVIYNMSSTSK